MALSNVNKQSCIVGCQGVARRRIEMHLISDVLVHLLFLYIHYNYMAL